MMKAIILVILAISLCLFFVGNAIGFTYTFSFFCPPGSYDSGWGESEVFHHITDGQVSVWVTHVANPSGACANLYTGLKKNGIFVIPQTRVSLCDQLGPCDVLATDQLQIRSQISCQNGPAGTITMKTTCVEDGMVPSNCFDEHMRHKQISSP